MKELDSPNADDDLENENETLVHDYSEASIIHDLDTRIIKFSPFVEFHPLEFFKRNYLKK